MILPQHSPALLASLALAIAITPGAAHAQEQTARLIKDTNRETSSYGGDTGWVSPLGKNVIFTRTTIARGEELWISNGTTGGTKLLKEFVPGPASWQISDPHSYGTGTAARVAFTTLDPATLLKQVWVTDGTEAGTVSVYDTNAQASQQLRPVAGTPGGFIIWKFTYDSSTEPELWFSDGTEAGTHLLTPEGIASPARFEDPDFDFSDGAFAYFRANGNETWRSDGTEAGTTLIIRNPAAGETPFTPFGIAGDHLFAEGFTADTSELWSFPKEGGTPVRLGPPPGVAMWWYPQTITIGEKFFFSMRDEDFNQHLWISDGTEAGTQEIELPLEDYYTIGNVSFNRWHGDLYVLAEIYHEHTDAQATVLYRTDGTEQGTFLLRNFPSSTDWLTEDLNKASWQESNDTLYFSNIRLDAELNPISTDIWETKGTAATTRLVKGISSTHYLNATQSGIVATESGKFFTAPAGRGLTGNALYRQRGTKGGAARVTGSEKFTTAGAPTFDPKIFPYDAKARTYELVGNNLLSFVQTSKDIELWRMDPDGNKAKAIWKPSLTVLSYGALVFRGTTAHGALFTCSDGIGTHEVWVTDGTKKGTRRLSQHGGDPDTGNSPYEFVKLGDAWYYSSVGGMVGSLWKTDGTPEGTSRLFADMHIPPALVANNIVAFDGNIWFPAKNSSGYFGLWRTDGTSTDAVPVKDFFAVNARAIGLSVVRAKLMFSVRSPGSQVLWQSDGTTDGTIPAPSLPAPNPPAYTFHEWGVMSPLDLNGSAIFPGKRKLEAPTYQQWWCSTPTGIRPLRNNVTSEEMYSWDAWDETRAVAGSQFFYSSQWSLWVSNGTPIGARDLQYQAPSGFSAADNMLAVGDQIYFSAWSPGHGRELWRSDGTTAGTTLVADINPGTTDSNPQGLKVMGNKLYFTADRLDTGCELFSIDLPQ